MSSDIAASLAGKRIAITGTTGFLGTALVERLLRSVPDCSLVLLVRPGRRGAPHRVQREILRNNAFDRLREQWGDEFAERADQRIAAVAADITQPGLGLDDDGRAALADCDIVVHSAASVSFDNPLDVAVETNLLGPVRLLETLNEMGHQPYLVAVSTAYVAGNRKGDAPEHLLADSPYAVDIDWRTEVDAARRARTKVEDESRVPAQLESFRKEASAEIGAAGLTALAARSEQNRRRWVKDQLAELGIARAVSLGFPDAYALTKAMAETAMVETRGDIPLSIVRPSIIESSWAEPFPGWIRGFRMAEPVILGFGRGLLQDFPSSPESHIDVIPVDLVAAAIIAVAAHEPAPEPVVFQSASGAVNPFRFDKFLRWGTDWFRRNPVYDERNQPIPPPRWTFPSTQEVNKKLGRAQTALQTAENVVRALPVRGRKALIAADLEEQRAQVEQAQTYIKLYGKYVTCEADYQIDNLLALWDQQSPADQETFNFDPRSIDWKHYVENVHLPAVIEQSRVKTAPNDKKRPDRAGRLRGQVLAPERHLAAFDLENTLIASNVVGSWGWLATHRLERGARARIVARTLLEAPGLLALDRRDRSDFLRHFYRRYRGAPVDQIAEDSQELFNDMLLAHAFPAAIRRVREHRALGHRTVLITGALDFVVEPLRPLFDEVICAHLEVNDGRYNGLMTGAAPTGESRAQALRDYAEREGLSLSESVVYADSTSDLPLLEAVAYPVAVNPETKLATLARRRGWLVEVFDPSPGAPMKLLPIAPRRRSPRKASV